MKALPFVTFFGTLVIIALLAVWQHQETQTASAQSAQQLQQAQNTLQTVKSSAQANTARLKKLSAVAAQAPAAATVQAPEAGANTPHQMHNHKVAGGAATPSTSEPSDNTGQTAAAISEAADTIKAAQAENEKITQTPAITTATPAPTATTSSSQRFIVLCLLTVFGCGLSTFFLIAKRFGPAEKQIASATLGTILGYWFSSAS